ncbi:hypothetical protein MMC30_006953 [Trapelia coarctata]|nr:hypothetical protein [Trapelia coarctata]
MGSQADLESTYDYIVCGGGTSGCVIAARLAEDSSVTVLVIEAGEHSDNVVATGMPGGITQIINSTADWNILSEPGEGVNNRQVPLSRGKVLGGSSTLNGTLCIRGTKTDYDEWGLDGWSGDEVFGYMSKAETFHPKPWFQEDKRSHGSSGPLHTSPHDLAPISKLLLTSYESHGFPLEPDMFTTGETAHGCGHAVRTVLEGRRTIAADYVTKSSGQNNLSILTNSVVDKVTLETHKTEVKATSVKVVSADGAESLYKARKEIILSAGAYCSPTILLRSGIGAKDEVEKHDLKHHVHIPGVGKNLMDHLIVWATYGVGEPNLTSDHLIYYEGAMAQAVEHYTTNKTGFLSTVPFGAIAFARLDKRLADSPLWKDASVSGHDPMGQTLQQPNVEFFSTECYPGLSHLFADFPPDGKSAFATLTELFAPRSRGTVQLKSADPTVNPVVDHNYLRDELDLLVLAEGCRYQNEIVMQGSGTKEVVTGAWPPSAKHDKFTTREEWMGYVKDQATTCYHPAGTCKMGKDDDPLAVVDTSLRVRGVSNLRVVDVSVMPTLNSGHPQMAAYAIGEKAADMIKADARASKPVRMNGTKD